MTKILMRQLASLQSKPGVYQFFDAQNNLLYVGKAKTLNSRVRSYFHTKAELSPSKKIMVAKIHHLITTEVANETEALLLEKTLIKKHLPPYNIDLRDDKSWLYLTINYQEKYPTVSLVRRPRPTIGLKIYGPFVAAHTIRSLFPLFKKLFGLKTCSNGPDKPCFQASLGRCLGHDYKGHGNSHYLNQLKLFENILKGNLSSVIKSLTQTMAAAAKKENYEQAAKLRDQLKSLLKLKEKQTIVSSKKESFDVIGLARNRQSTAVVRLPVKQGVLQEAERFLLENTRELGDADILNDFLEQLDSTVNYLSKKIYLPTKLAGKNFRSFAFLVPSRGNKKKLLTLAINAAASHLEQSLASWQRKEVRAKNGLKQLRDVLQLSKEPERIEGYDISNIQGQEAVGSLVVLTKGLPDPKQYRKFKIQAPAKPNDFQMLAEMLVRRFTKNKDWPKPDLVMLDGGAGQLSVVKKALEQKGIKLPLIALAKREELIYLMSNKTIRLPSDSPALLLLELLRDEAHRFGITYYRSRHRHRLVKSAWDELPGIGPALKRKLKSNYPSINALRQTNLKDLSHIIGHKKAQAIMDFFN